MLRTMLAVLAGAALLAPGAAQAQDSRWERQVRYQLNRAGDLLSDKGYGLSHELRWGTLDDDASEYFTLELDAGRAYALLGVCDEDCTDLDLRLFDADGNEVDQDLETDDYPVVEVRPGRTAVYRVKVIMATCSTSPCFYGVGVFAK
ncbi:MAG TPA: hypothetical protein VNI61_08770 [Gemmatimonadales bacterium]|nr:hypothetical protein [Gemmatimonadales bacterium]